MELTLPIKVRGGQANRGWDPTVESMLETIQLAGHQPCVGGAHWLHL